MSKKNFDIHSIFNSGQYKGKTPVYVYRKDRNYLIRLNNDSNYPYSFNMDKLADVCERECCYDNSLDDFLHKAQSGELTPVIFSDNIMLKAIKTVFDVSANHSQRKAWKTSFDCLSKQLMSVNRKYPGLDIIFEYGLRNDSYKRPDAILICKEIVIVLEFKDYRYSSANTAENGQVRNYAYKLRHNHVMTRELNQIVVPVLVYTKGDGLEKYSNELCICTGDKLGNMVIKILDERVNAAGINQLEDLHAWEKSDYERNIDITREAKQAFMDKNLEHIKVKEHADFPNAELDSIIKYNKDNKKHTVVFVTGVPGGGKTYLGLEYVYKQEPGTAVYLSGNMPLLSVLRGEIGDNAGETLKGTYEILKNYLHDRSALSMAANIVVFDEGQRTWNAQQVRDRYHNEVDGVYESEAHLLLEMTGKLEWAVMIILVGNNQEIYKGETIGLEEWKKAICNNNKWEAIYPPEKEPELNGTDLYKGPVIDREKLRLSKFERSGLADKIGDLVNAIMDNRTSDAKAIIDHWKKTEGAGSRETYHMFVTRDLENARKYCVNNYNENAQYGLICSSKGQTKDMNNNIVAVGNKVKEKGREIPFDYFKWYDGDGDEEDICRGFKIAVSEFGCQGLELDLPIIVWHSDMYRSYGKWKAYCVDEDIDARISSRYRINSYRVLLSRGRSGFIIYISNEPGFNDVYNYFVDLGIPVLPEQQEKDDTDTEEVTLSF